MTTTTKKYELLTPMQRHRLAQTNEREFLALKADHEARLERLNAQRAQCRTFAERKRLTASIDQLLTIPRSSAA